MTQGGSCVETVITDFLGGAIEAGAAQAYLAEAVKYLRWQVSLSKVMTLPQSLSTELHANHSH